MSKQYRIQVGDWHDAEAACDGEFTAIEEYDSFGDLEFDVWQAKFMNGRLAAIVLAYPGVILLSEEHSRAEGAITFILDAIAGKSPIRMWYHVRGDEQQYAEQLGLSRAPYFEDDTYVAPGVSEIEAHRLLKAHNLDR